MKVLFLYVFAIAIGGFLSVNAWNGRREAQQELAAVRAERAEAVAERVEIARERARVDSAAGRERLAREAGMADPAETLVTP